MHSESTLMYFDSMQMCSEGIPLHFASIRAYFESMRIRIYECIWNVYDYRYISSYNVKRTQKAAMAFHSSH